MGEHAGKGRTQVGDFGDGSVAAGGDDGELSAGAGELFDDEVGAVWRPVTAEGHDGVAGDGDGGSAGDGGHPEDGFAGGLDGGVDDAFAVGGEGGIHERFDRAGGELTEGDDGTVGTFGGVEPNLGSAAAVGNVDEFLGGSGPGAHALVAGGGDEIFDGAVGNGHGDDVEVGVVLAIEDGLAVGGCGGRGIEGGCRW